MANVAESAPGPPAHQPKKVWKDVHSAGEWEANKEVIIRLYMDNTLREVMEIMERKHGFRASSKLFKSHLQRWRISKNLSRKEAAAKLKTDLLEDKIHPPALLPAEGTSPKQPMESTIDPYSGLQRSSSLVTKREFPELFFGNKSTESPAHNAGRSTQGRLSWIEGDEPDTRWRVGADNNQSSQNGNFHTSGARNAPLLMGGASAHLLRSPEWEVMRSPSRQGSQSLRNGTVSPRTAGSLPMPPPENAASEMKQRVVDRAMRFFVDYLCDLLQVKENTGKDEGSNSSSCAGSRAPSKDNMAHPSRALGWKRQRGNDGYPDDDQGGEGSRGPKRTKNSLSDSQPEVFLACPFAKHSPWQYMRRRPCCGPEWPDVGRVKEHVYRCHSVPRFSCPRCFKRYNSQVDLSTHSRSEPPCRTLDQDPNPPDGIDEDTRAKLKSRKYDRNDDGLVDEDKKWKQMYRICFPDVLEENTPSAYYDGNYGLPHSLDDFDAFLLRGMPPAVRREIQDEVERYPHLIEDGGARLVAFVTDLVPRLMRNTFRLYRATIQNSAVGRGTTNAQDPTSQAALVPFQPPSPPPPPSGSMFAQYSNDDNFSALNFNYSPWEFNFDGINGDELNRANPTPLRPDDINPTHGTNSTED